MIDRMIADIVFILSFVVVIALLVFGAKYYQDQQNVRDITFSLVQHVSTSGTLTTKDYNAYRRDLNKFGEFDVVVKFSKRLDDDIYDHFFNLADILDRRMDNNDEISVSIRQLNEPFIGKLLNMPIFFNRNQKRVDPGIEVLYSAPIDARSKDIVDGYDVIADIKNNLTTPNVSIFVSTKLNLSGKVYSNEVYGDTTDETQPFGDNYIHPAGEFRKEKILNGDNSVTINYYQVY